MRFPLISIFDDMKKNIIETQYFPSIAWWCLAMSHKSVSIDGAENYNKRSLRNKARIGKFDQDTILSVPLKKGKHQGQSIQEVSISNEIDWRQDHLRSIQVTYGKSPYFIHYIDDVREFILSPEIHLFNFNLNITREIIEILGLPIQLNIELDFYKTSNEWTIVYRDQLKYAGFRTSFEQVLDERIGNQADFTHIPYKITSRNSILDLLFHLGPESRLFLSDLQPHRIFGS